MSDEELPRDPNADITDAIAALSPEQRNLAMAIIDRVSALTGMTELRFMDRQQALADTLAKIAENQAAFSHPLGALVAKQDLITEHLQRQDASLAGLKEGQSVMRADFQAAGENLNQWQSKVEETLASHARWLASHDGSRDESIAERKALREGLEASAADRKVLHRDLEASKADRKAIRKEQQTHNVAMTKQLSNLAAAIEQIRLQYEELKKSFNGRLTQLIEASEAIARLEGRDEERAHPGVD